MNEHALVVERALSPLNRVVFMSGTGLPCRFGCRLAWRVPGDVVVVGSDAQRERDAHELEEHGAVFGAGGSDLTRPHRRRLSRVGSAVS